MEQQPPKSERRTMMQDIERAAELARRRREVAPYLLTSSSVARVERDILAGKDPRTGFVDEPTAEELAAHDAKPSTISAREGLAKWELPDTGTSGLPEQNHHGNR